MVKCNTYVNTGDIIPGSYEMSVSTKQNKYETVVDYSAVGPVTVNPDADERAGHEDSSAFSSLFYQYVPSKVRNFSQISYWIIK